MVRYGGHDRPLFEIFETLRNWITTDAQGFWRALVELYSLVLGLVQHVGMRRMGHEPVEESGLAAVGSNVSGAAQRWLVGLGQQGVGMEGRVIGQAMA